KAATTGTTTRTTTRTTTTGTATIGTATSSAVRRKNSNSNFNSSNNAATTTTTGTGTTAFSAEISASTTAAGTYGIATYSASVWDSRKNSNFTYGAKCRASGTSTAVRGENSNPDYGTKQNTSPRDSSCATTTGTSSTADYYAGFAASEWTIAYGTAAYGASV